MEKISNNPSLFSQTFPFSGDYSEKGDEGEGNNINTQELKLQ